jgi:GH25 family lysozyme M1 (1,4-beta-N-acetylmuramidase)
LEALCKGLDLSKWNGNVDFNKVKQDGYSFVILRSGYRQTQDPKFEQYYYDATSAGLMVGAYWFTYANTVAGAENEAKACIEYIRGKKFDYPIYYDLEDDPSQNSYPLKTGKANCSAMVDIFCKTLQNAGYWAGLYTSKSVLETHITPEVANKYAIWVAQWSNKCTYSGQYGMWQCTDRGVASGIKGNVDIDVAYVNYPSLVREKGLNGYSKSTPTTPAKGKTFYRVYIDKEFNTEDDALMVACLINGKVSKVTRS